MIVKDAIAKIKKENEIRKIEQGNKNKYYFNYLEFLRIENLKNKK